MKENHINRAAALAVNILSDCERSAGDRTYALVMLQALKDGNRDGVEIQLARITGSEAEELLAELRADDQPTTVLSHCEDKAKVPAVPQSAEPEESKDTYLNNRWIIL